MPVQIPENGANDGLALIQKLIAAVNAHDVELANHHFSSFDLRSQLHDLFQAFPDIVFRPTEFVQSGSKIVVFWTARGTHKGPFLNIPATDREIEVHGISSFTVLDGIVRVDQLWDIAAMLRCMRLLPDWPKQHRSIQPKPDQDP